jgi:hypothetical protein
MKKNIGIVFKIFAVLVCISISSCKVNDRIKPIANDSLTFASIPTLKIYLSKTLAVSENEISYDQNAHEFVIRKGIVIKENEVQSHYRIANEFKVRNGITN